MSNLYFMECASCRAKPGSPVLCESCLHNRLAIDSLKRFLKNRESATRRLVRFLRDKLDAVVGSLE